LQTAQIIARHTGHVVVADERLRERHLGILQGLTWDEVRLRYPREPDDFETPGPDYVIPGGESQRQCFTRVLACLEEIARRHPGESVVIVTHVGALEAVFRHSLGIPLERPRGFALPNASVNAFVRHQKDRWVLETWGETSHLLGLKTSNENQ
jgi:probable phosphoglycerate mutase